MIGLSGLITPVARRDGPRRPEMERAGVHDPAPDRRGDDQRQAHGGQDRPAAITARSSTSRTPRGASASSTASTAPRPGPSSTARTASMQEKERVAFAKQAAAQARPLRRGRARAGSPSTGRPSPIAVPAFLGAAGARRRPARGARPVHRLVAVLHDLGAEGQVPGDLRTTRSSATRRRELFDDAQALLDRIVAEKLLTATRRLRLLPGQLRRRRHRPLHRRVADGRAAPVPRRSASSGSARGRRTSAAWPTTSPRSTRAGPTTSAPSP